MEKLIILSDRCSIKEITSRSPSALELIRLWDKLDKQNRASLAMFKILHKSGTEVKVYGFVRGNELIIYAISALVKKVSEDFVNDVLDEIRRKYKGSVKCLSG
ncbi:MAG: hypothetical protein DRO18_06105 [Thermoprotei archaeon]|nr:MAG: hypothetical protein DRO18_06105 [Thermoprotei archaeon]